MAEVDNILVEYILLRRTSGCYCCCCSGGGFVYIPSCPILGVLSSGVLSMVHGYRFMNYYIIEHELQRIRVICFLQRLNKYRAT